MISFDTTMHDFGTIKQNSLASTIFSYTGDEELKTTDFVPSCGCTGGSYHPDVKQYVVGIQTNQVGSKQVNIAVKNSAYLILKINVVA